jgi:hypothetical protein
MRKRRTAKWLGIRNDRVGLTATSNQLVCRIDTSESHLVLVTNKGLQWSARVVDVPQLQSRID